LPARVATPDDRPAVARYHGMRLLIPSLFLVACHSSPPAATVANRPPPSSAKAYPAKLYAGLFVRGAHFTYKVDSESTYWDDSDPNADKSGNVTNKSTGTMTCTVAEVVELPSAIAAALVCDDSINVPTSNASPRGTYVATAAGLWRTDGIPAEAPSDPKTMLLPAVPAETKLVDKDPDNEGFWSETSISRSGDGWCREESSVAGDEGGSSICFGNGAITGGSASFAGGSSHDATYTLTSR
jgi:hypothetical protein